MARDNKRASSSIGPSSFLPTFRICSRVRGCTRRTPLTYGTAGSPSSTSDSYLSRTFTIIGYLHYLLPSSLARGAPSQPEGSLGATTLRRSFGVANDWPPGSVSNTAPSSWLACCVTVLCPLYTAPSCSTLGFHRPSHAGGGLPQAWRPRGGQHTICVETRYFEES